MKTIKDYWFIIVIVILCWGNITQWFNPIIKTEVKEVEVIKTVVERDTLIQFKYKNLPIYKIDKKAYFAT